MHLSPRLLSVWLVVLGSFSTLSRAAVPPPEQLLPADTIAFFSVPDWDKMSSFYKQSPQARLWDDPGLKGFKDNFLKKFNSDVVDPLQKQLGIQFQDYVDLVHGQLTIAIAQSPADDTAAGPVAFALIVDSKQKSSELTTQLTKLKKKWADSGKQLRAENIRGIDFTTVVVSKADLAASMKKAFPNAAKDQDNAVPNGTFELRLGQSDSLLIVGNQPKWLEKIVARQSGATVPSLAEQAAYQSNQAMFRDSLFTGWLHFKPIFSMITAKLKENTQEQKSKQPFSLDPEKILGALGLGGLNTISFKAGGNSDGSNAELFLGIPENQRKGLFAILVPEAKDASPPTFVPSDAVKFSRWRIDGKKAWASLEAMVSSISPEIAGSLQLALSMLGKDRDPDFDLKTTLIGNLGDDFISFQKLPKNPTLAELSSPPSLFLIGSPNPEKLVTGLKTAVSFVPNAGGNQALKEREFLGRRIYTMPIMAPPAPNAAEKAEPKNLNFAASGSYLAISSDATLIEEFLRSGESSAKPLRETPGLNDASQKVGGTSTGFFGFENQRETMRATFEALKKDQAALENIFALTFKGSKGGSTLKQWFDFSLLPAFDSVAKYFSLVVYAGNVSNQGMGWKFYTPTPGQMR